MHQLSQSDIQAIATSTIPAEHYDRVGRQLGALITPKGYEWEAEFHPAGDVANVKAGDIIVARGLGQMRRGVAVKVGRSRVTIAYVTPTSIEESARYNHGHYAVVATTTVDIAHVYVAGAPDPVALRREADELDALSGRPTEYGARLRAIADRIEPVDQAPEQPAPERVVRVVDGAPGTVRQVDDDGVIVDLDAGVDVLGSPAAFAPLTAPAKPTNMKVAVTLVLDVDVAGWMLDYGVDESAARQDAVTGLPERVREAVHDDAAQLGLYAVVEVMAKPADPVVGRRVIRIDDDRDVPSEGVVEDIDDPAGEWLLVAWMNADGTITSPAVRVHADELVPARR